MNINGKTIIFLGSSVTYGSAANGVSFADILVKTDKIIAIKEAVSGTTLVDDMKDGTSYVERMKTIGKDVKADMFVCQLSTNDAWQKKILGEVSDNFKADLFDTTTIAGAMEYIISYVKDTWNCPVIFYTGTKFDSEEYQKMIDLLSKIKNKWNIGVLDLWNDEEMNSVCEEDYKKYMNDPVHPNIVGYEKWWAPKFREYFKKFENEE